MAKRRHYSAPLGCRFSSLCRLFAKGLFGGGGKVQMSFDGFQKQCFAGAVEMDAVFVAHAQAFALVFDAVLVAAAAAV